MTKIPAHWAPSTCTEDTCTATATVTLCDDPVLCTEDICKWLVACDKHADGLARMGEMILAGTAVITVERTEK